MIITETRPQVKMAGPPEARQRVPASQVQAEIITTKVKAGRYFWLEASVAISSGEWVIFSGSATAMQVTALFHDMPDLDSQDFIQA